jgi:ATP-dependent exoDNAse (exonuclease V) beta subunit
VPTPDYFVYGKLVHKIIEEYTKAKGKRDINEIKKACLDGEILLEDKAETPPKEVLSQAYINKLPGHLRSFMKLCNKVGFDGQCEYDFNFDLDPPHGKYVNGFIDRLIHKGDKYIIIDYKTTKKGPWRQNKRDVVSDLQLQCYSMIVKEHFKADAANIYAALYYLEGEEFIGANFTDKTLQQCRERLLDAYNEIEMADPDKVRGRIGRHCDRCDYRSICPALGTTRHK